MTWPMILGMLSLFGAGVLVGAWTVARSVGRYIAAGSLQATLRGFTPNPFPPDSYRARWWNIGYCRKQDLLEKQTFEQDRDRAESWLKAIAGHAAFFAAVTGDRPPEPNEALAMAEVEFLTRAGWTLAPQPLRWRGMCWAPPWDPGGRWTTTSALAEQRARRTNQT